MYDCDPSGEGCGQCPRYMNDCDGKEDYEDEPPDPIDHQGRRRR